MRLTWLALASSMLALLLAPAAEAAVTLDGSTKVLVALQEPWGQDVRSLRGRRDLRFIITLKEAAADLARYVTRTTGAKAAVGAWREGFDGVVIHVGRTPFVKARGLKTEDLDLEGYVIKTVGSNVMLVGRTDLATRHAVYAFTEKRLGVRWYWPSELGTYVPPPRRVDLGDLDERSNPASWARYFTVHARTESRRWERRNRLQDHWTVRLKGNSHSMAAILPRKAYSETHPEYFALRKGKRNVPPTKYLERRAAYCLTNPKVAEITADWIKHYFEKRPEAFSVSMAMNDTTWYCECPRCRAEGVPGATDGPNYADRYFGFVNRVARLVRPTCPGKFIGVLAYGGASVLPNRLKAVESNVNIYLVSGSPGYNYLPAWKQRRFDLTRKWAEFAGSVCIYTYQFGSAGSRFFQMPVFYPKLVAEELRFCRKVGVKGQVIEMLPFWAFSPRPWIVGKLLWDPSRSVDGLLDDFCPRMFGPAAGDMKRYFGLLGKAWLGQGPMKKLSGSDSQYAVMLPCFPRLEQALASAARRARTPEQKARVQFFADGLRTTRLFARSWEISGRFNPFPATARQTFTALKAARDLYANEKALERHRDTLEKKYKLTKRMIAPRDKTYLVRETLERCAAWFEDNGYKPEAALLRSSPAAKLGKPGENALQPGGLAAILAKEEAILAKAGLEPAKGDTGATLVKYVDNAAAAEKTGARLLIRESFESEGAIRGNGGAIKGKLTFEPGLSGKAAFLCSKDAVVGYPVDRINPRAGAIEFFVKTRWAGRKGNFNVCLVCTGGNFDPPGHLSIRAGEAKGRRRLSFTLYTVGVVAYALVPVRKWEEDTWHHLAAVWQVDPKRPKENRLVFYVDGKPYATRHKIARARDVKLKGPFAIGNRPVSQRFMTYPLVVVDELRVYDRPIPPKAFSGARIKKR